MLRAAPEVFANFLAPYFVYQALDASYGDTGAMIASALPPLAWSVYELVKTRRLDAISLTVSATILLTVGATAMGGSARLIQIRDALVTGAVGIAFLISLGFRRPLIFILARAMVARNEAGVAAYDTAWDQPGVPVAFRWLTIFWGFGLVGQTATMCWLAWVWPIPRFLLVSPVISFAIFGALMAVSLGYITRRPAVRAILAGRIKGL